MSWVARVLHRTQRPAAHPPVLPPAEAASLKAAQRRHEVLLDRADEAIRQAMEQADELMGGSTYRGPDRRQGTR